MYSSNSSPMTARSLAINRDHLIQVLFINLRIVWHVLFWCAGFIVLLNIFAGSSEPEKIDFIYTLFFILPIVAGVYLNLYLFIPRLLRKGYLFFYLLAMALLIAFVAGIIYLLFDRWIDLLLQNYFFISYDEYWILLIYASVFLALSTLLKLSREWMLFLRGDRQKNIVKLKNLQAQINPHFLLNSLQTIYSMSMNRSEKTPETVLQLAEILKFSLYETEYEKVSLARELEVLRDYIAMYRHRLDPIRAKITFNIEGDSENLQVVPLLFLPFIENAFKHGLQGSEKKAFVHINFRINENMLNFDIENNIGNPDSHERKIYSGIGIENTRKRLDISYPDRHQLKINRENEVFKVSLKLDLSP